MDTSFLTKKNICEYLKDEIEWTSHKHVKRNLEGIYKTISKSKYKTHDIISLPALHTLWDRGIHLKTFETATFEICNDKKISASQHILKYYEAIKDIINIYQKKVIRKRNKELFTKHNIVLDSNNNNNTKKPKKMRKRKRKYKNDTKMRKHKNNTYNKYESDSDIAIDLTKKNVKNDNNNVKKGGKKAKEKGGAISRKRRLNTKIHSRMTHNVRKNDRKNDDQDKRMHKINSRIIGNVSKNSRTWKIAESLGFNLFDYNNDNNNNRSNNDSNNNRSNNNNGRNKRRRLN